MKDQITALLERFASKSLQQIFKSKWEVGFTCHCGFENFDDRIVIAVHKDGCEDDAVRTERLKDKNAQELLEYLLSLFPTHENKRNPSSSRPR